MKKAFAALAVVIGIMSAATVSAAGITKEEAQKKALEAVSLKEDQVVFVPVEEATFNADRNYVMLTTCAYVFDDARYIIFGKLVPVQSAGGVALPKSKSLITN